MEFETTPKGYKFIKVDTVVFMDKLQSPCICDMCNRVMLPTVNYIAVLNQGYCDSCFDDWSDQSQYYEEDKHFEDGNIRIMKKILEIE